MRDIREIKRRLREEIKQWRAALPADKKQRMDAEIARRLMQTRQFQQAGTMLIYVATSIEVETRPIIEAAWELGKRVAVPYCIDGTREMMFYQITDFSQLERRTFGVWEPVPQRCALMEDFSDSICVVPALAYDLEGYRLGYGAGYYDRFLSRYPGYKIGIVYSGCVKSRLTHGRYDLPVDLLITEKRLLRIRHNPRRNAFNAPAGDSY